MATEERFPGNWILSNITYMYMYIRMNDTEIDENVDKSHELITYLINEGVCVIKIKRTASYVFIYNYALFTGTLSLFWRRIYSDNRERS